MFDTPTRLRSILSGIRLERPEISAFVFESSRQVFLSRDFFYAEKTRIKRVKRFIAFSELAEFRQLSDVRKALLDIIESIDEEWARDKPLFEMVAL